MTSDILNPQISEEFSHLFGKRDKIIPISEKWPVYEIDIDDKNGFWSNFNLKLKELENKNLLSQPTDTEINDFYYKNSDIEFEIHFMDDVLKKNFLFKCNGQIYSYIVGKKSKRSKKLYYVRFFFDAENFFNY
jgi:hypothetical protein